MKCLSLFSGAGGGDLAAQHLLGFETVGYVEWDKYCQKILAQRIKDGFLDQAPIFGDIDHFIESRAAQKYQGFVDILTAGFPCQPFSVAGKKRGQDDERNKWPQTIQTIRDVQPRFAFLENVPGLLNSGYFHEVLGSLAEAGYDAKWIVLGADDVRPPAPHRRKRLWILAYSVSDSERAAYGSEEWIGGCEGQDIGEGSSLRSDFGDSGENVADTGSKRLEGSINEKLSASERSQDVADSESRHRNDNEAVTRLGGSPTQKVFGNGSSVSGEGSWWSTEPDVGRVAHGVASRVDRLKALGNGQVPQCTALAWKILNDCKGE